MTAASQNQPVVFVTASVPMSMDEEAFVQDELTQMLASGLSMRVVPTRQRDSRANDAATAAGLAEVTIAQPLFSGRIFVAAIRMTVRRPIAISRIIATLFTKSGSIRSLAKNLAVLPKALWLSSEATEENARHIHAYWLAQTATIAWVVSELTGLPWSASAFRWDIDAENLFEPKFRSARFLRCADEFGFDGLERARDRLGASTPIQLIRTGVSVQPPEGWQDLPVDATTIVCVGAFVEKKAQALLVKAFAELAPEYDGLQLHLVGEGPCAPSVHLDVERLGLDDVVHFHGTLPLAEVRSILRRRPITVLPSIIASDGQQEGIPVVLIEAMANGSPVVSTPTGAIQQLVRDGCGVLVKPGDVRELAIGIRSLLDQPERAASISRDAYWRVREEFDLVATSRRLMSLCLGPAAGSA